MPISIPDCEADQGSGMIRSVSERSDAGCAFCESDRDRSLCFEAVGKVEIAPCDFQGRFLPVSFPQLFACRSFTFLMNSFAYVGIESRHLRCDARSVHSRSEDAIASGDLRSVRPGSTGTAIGSLRAYGSDPRRSPRSLFYPLPTWGPDPVIRRPEIVRFSRPQKLP